MLSLSPYDGISLLLLLLFIYAYNIIIRIILLQQLCYTRNNIFSACNRSYTRASHRRHQSPWLSFGRKYNIQMKSSCIPSVSEWHNIIISKLNFRVICPTIQTHSVYDMYSFCDGYPSIYSSLCLHFTGYGIRNASSYLSTSKGISSIFTGRGKGWETQNSYVHPHCYKLWVLISLGD